MVARRTNSRRRRVLNEEIVRTEELPTKEHAPDPRKSKLLAYSSGANRRNQLKTTDLLPKRWLAFATVVIGLFTCITAINLLAYYAPSMRPYIGQTGTESFAISGKGTLACWFTSFMLISTALASLQIYALRQHRRDDYQGSYRIWAWMALLFLIASIDCAVGLRAIANNVFEAMSQRSFSHNPWLVISIPLILLTIVAIRGLLEVRASRAALSAVFLVWLTYVGGIVVQSTWVRQEFASLDVPLVYGNCVLCATAGLLVVHFIYARFVYLHAHGLIEVTAKVEKQPAKEKRAKTKTKSKKTPTRSTRKSTSKKKVESAEAEETSTLDDAAITETEQEQAQDPILKHTKKTSRVRTAKVSSKTKTKAKSKIETAKSHKSDKSSNDKSVSSFEELSGLLGKSSGGSHSQKATSKKSAKRQESDSDEEPQILSMSKAEKRRRRKLEKQRRKAA